MSGLVPVTHDFFAELGSWMAEKSPAVMNVLLVQRSSTATSSMCGENMNWSTGVTRVTR